MSLSMHGMMKFIANFLYLLFLYWSNRSCKTHLVSIFLSQLYYFYKQVPSLERFNKRHGEPLWITLLISWPLLPNKLFSFKSKKFCSLEATFLIFSGATWIITVSQISININITFRWYWINFKVLRVISERVFSWYVNSPSYGLYLGLTTKICPS